MLKIKRVDTLDDHTLELEMEDESIILFNTTRLMERDPAFAALKGEKRFLLPETDGAAVYWYGGPMLTLREILTMLGERPDKQSGKKTI